MICFIPFLWSTKYPAAGVDDDWPDGEGDDVALRLALILGKREEAFAFLFLKIFGLVIFGCGNQKLKYEAN